MSKARLLIPLAIFTVYALALFNRSVLGIEALFWHDTSIDSIPLHAASAEAIGDGRIPLWDARIGNGFSVMGETQAGVFYPPNVIYYIGIPQYQAHAISLALHCVMAAFFTVLFCRLWALRWTPCIVAGLIYGFSGWFISHAQVIAMVQAGAWIPLILVCLELWLRNPRQRKWLVGGAVAVAMMGLCSHPHILSYTALGLLLYMVVGAFGQRPETGASRPPGRLSWAVRCALALAIVLALGAMLSAIQMFPSGAMLPSSARSELTVERAREMALRPHNLAYFVHPYILGSYAEGDYFGRDHQYEVLGFVGTIALLFGIVGAIYGRGRGRAFAVALVPLALFMALANQNPLYEYLIHVPFLGKFRGAGRYVLLSSFGFAVLAAYGLHVVTESRPARRTALILSVIGVLLCIATPFGLRLARPQVVRGLSSFLAAEGTTADEARAKAEEKYAFFLKRLSPTDLNSLMILLCLVGSGVACGVQLRRRDLAWGVAELALGLTAAQLFIFAYHYNPTIDTRYYTSEPELIRLLDKQAGEALFHPDEKLISLALPGSRAWAEGDMSYHWLEWELARPNRQVIYGARNVSVAYGLVTQRNRELLGLLTRSLWGEPDEHTGLMIRNPVEVLRAVGARIIVTHRLDALEDLPVAKDLGTVLARDAGSVAPLAYFAESIVPCKSGREALEQMCASGFNFRRPVVELPEGETVATSRGRPLPQVLSYEDDHGHLTIRCRSSNRAFLAIREAYDPRFRCTIDGEPRSIFVTNYLFRGVVIEPGEHVVEMIYDAWDLRLGLYISLAALALMGLMLLTCRRPD